MKTIAIVGIEGIGKTRMVNFLCQKYNAFSVIEYGSWYCKNILKSYYDGKVFSTTKKDFKIIIEKQKKLYQEAFSKKTKVIFFDTDLIYTRYFIDAQFPKWNILNQELGQQRIDHYFFLQQPQIIKKENSLIKYHDHRKENKRLLALYRKHVNDKLIIIDDDNFCEAKKTIINLLTKIL